MRNPNMKRTHAFEVRQTLDKEHCLEMYFILAHK